MPMYENVVCNWCGETCVLDEGAGHSSPHGMIYAQARGYYSSTPGNGQGALDDGSTYTFSLCEFCVDALMSRFKHPPTLGDYLHGDECEPFRPAEQRVREDDWRRFKSEFFTEKERRDKLRG